MTHAVLELLLEAHRLLHEQLGIRRERCWYERVGNRAILVHPLKLLGFLSLLVEVVHELLLLQEKIFMILVTLVERWESHGEILVLSNPLVRESTTLGSSRHGHRRSISASIGSHICAVGLAAVLAALTGVSVGVTPTEDGGRCL